MNVEGEEIRFTLSEVYTHPCNILYFIYTIKFLCYA